MKTIVLYHPNSDHERAVLTFQGDFERMTSFKPQLVSLESVEGSNYAELYGINHYPAVVALKDDGQYLKHWEGDQLPLIQEVAGYLV